MRFAWWVGREADRFHSMLHSLGACLSSKFLRSTRTHWPPSSGRIAGCVSSISWQSRATTRRGTPDLQGASQKSLAAGNAYLYPTIHVPGYGSDQGWTLKDHPRMLGRMGALSATKQLSIVGFGNKGVVLY